MNDNGDLQVTFKSAPRQPAAGDEVQRPSVSFMSDLFFCSSFFRKVLKQKSSLK